MSALREIKMGLAALGGLALTIYGWHFTSSTGIIFNGFSFAGPVFCVVGWYAVACRYGGLPKRFLYSVAAIILGLVVAAANTVALKLLYPKAPIVNQFDDSLLSTNN